LKTKIKKEVEEKVCQRITSGRIRSRTAYSPATYPPTPQRRKIPQEAPRVLVGDDDVGEVEPEEAVGLFFSFFLFVSEDKREEGEGGRREERVCMKKRADEESQTGRGVEEGRYVRGCNIS
jgi:hypothetical protein